MEAFNQLFVLTPSAQIGRDRMGDERFYDFGAGRLLLSYEQASAQDPL
jgi:hypothetical protein